MFTYFSSVDGFIHLISYFRTVYIINTSNVSAYRYQIMVVVNRVVLIKVSCLLNTKAIYIPDGKVACTIVQSTNN